MPTKFDFACIESALCIYDVLDWGADGNVYGPGFSVEPGTDHDDRIRAYFLLVCNSIRDAAKYKSPQPTGEVFQVGQIVGSSYIEVSRNLIWFTFEPVLRRALDLPPYDRPGRRWSQHQADDFIDRFWGKDRRLTSAASAAIHAITPDDWSHVFQTARKFVDSGQIDFLLAKLSAEKLTIEPNSTETGVDQLEDIVTELAGDFGRRLDGDRFHFLFSHPKGVTFDEFCDYQNPDTGRQLTKTDDPYSIETMLRKLSKRLEPYGYEIFVSIPKDRIKLRPIAG